MCTILVFEGPLPGVTKRAVKGGRGWKLSSNSLGEMLFPGRYFNFGSQNILKWFQKKKKKSPLLYFPLQFYIYHLPCYNLNPFLYPSFSSFPLSFLLFLLSLFHFLSSFPFPSLEHVEIFTHHLHMKRFKTLTHELHQSIIDQN